MNEQVPKLFFRDAPLLRAHLLDTHSKNAGPLRKVINIASGIEELKHVPILHGTLLLLIEAEELAISVFIAPEGFSIRGFIKGEAHFVQCVPLHGKPPVEKFSSRNVVAMFHAHITRLTALQLPCRPPLSFQELSGPHGKIAKTLRQESERRRSVQVRTVKSCSTPKA
jgi:hypothetical protein